MRGWPVKKSAVVHARAQVPASPGGLLATAASPVREYLAETLGVVDLAGQDEDTLWAISDRGEQMEMAGRLIAGLANRELCTLVHNQQLTEELRRRGKTRRAFYYSIELLAAFEALPDARCVHSLAQVGFTRFREVLAWTPEERVRFAGGEEVRGITLEEAVGMSSRQFCEAERDWRLRNDDRLQKLERERAQLQTQLDIAKNQNKLLARAGAALQTEEDLPPFALVVRQEFLAITESMSFGLDNLQAIAAENLFREIQHPEAHRFQPVAAGTAYFALRAIHARAGALLTQIQETYGDDIGAVTLDHQLTAAEIKRFQEARALLLAQHQAKTKAREDARENNRPGKRGAKRK
jgi:hypothetical protein